MIKITKKIVKPILIILNIALICYCCYELFQIFRQYQVCEDVYNEIANAVTYIPESNTLPDPAGKKHFEIDFQALQSQNSDIVAWIYFDEPKQINYPVVHRNDNQYYLTHLFNQKKGVSGCIFLNSNNAKDFSDANSTIYGHRMKDGSMFGQLKKYKSKDYWNAHQYFYLFTPDGNCHVYQIFSVSTVLDGSGAYRHSFQDETDFQTYITDRMHASYYPTGITVEPGQKIISLSTCTGRTGSNHRLYVQGVEKYVYPYRKL